MLLPSLSPIPSFQRRKGILVVYEMIELQLPERFFAMNDGTWKRCSFPTLGFIGWKTLDLNNIKAKFGHTLWWIFFPGLLIGLKQRFYSALSFVLSIVIFLDNFDVDRILGLLYILGMLEDKLLDSDLVGRLVGEGLGGGPGEGDLAVADVMGVMKDFLYFFNLWSLFHINFICAKD